MSIGTALAGMPTLVAPGATSFVTTDPAKGTTKFTGDYQEFLKFKDELKSNQ